MNDRFERNRRAPGRGPAGPRGRSGSRPTFEDEPDEDYTEDQEEMESERAAGGRPRPGTRPRGRPSGGRPPQARSSGSWSLFGGGRAQPARSRRREGFDWDAVEEEDYGDEGSDEGRDRDREGEYDDPAPRRRAGPARRPGRRGRVTLMDLCTPIFAYGAMLPREAGGVHPGYQQFRQEVMTALQKVENAAADHGIDRDDAREARYALALFMDEQVADSEWAGKSQWVGEPLNVVVLNDPEGGVNFFTHLEALGDRQRAVKRIFLACLAMGFRGKYADLPPEQQASRIGEIRQRLLRSIQVPIENQDVLFPEAYESAVPLEGQAPPPPKTWMFASLGLIAVVVVFWLVLFWLAGLKPHQADEEVRKLLNRAPEVASGPATGGAETPRGEDGGQ